MKKALVFKMVAAWAGVYHLVLGALGVFGSEEFVGKVIYSVYGATLDMTLQTFYMVKFASAYMLAFGLAMLILAKSPEKYKNLVWVAILLFLVRVLERIIFSNILDAMGISTSTEIVTSIVILLMGGTLYLTRPR